MKLTGTVLLVLSCIFSLQGQVKSSHYALPVGVTSSNLVEGRVMVKIKPAYKALFTGGSASARSALQMQRVRSLAPKSTAKAQGRAVAFKQAIDISLYYEIQFDKSESVENYLNKLYASGYIEYAEPVYKE